MPELILTDYHDAADFFALEYYFMNLPQPPELYCFWSTPPTLMLGLNQIAQQEIDLDAAEKYNVQIRRRKSGGGTIYTDPMTLQVSHLIPHTDNPAECLTSVSRELAKALQEAGFPADFSTRNDILVDGRKVSGAAGYLLNGHYMYHASLLFQTDLSILTKLLTVDPAKLTLHGIKSVRQRVANLSEFTDMTFSQFTERLRQTLVPDNAKVRTLADSEREAITDIRTALFGKEEWNLNRGAQEPALQTFPPDRQKR